MVWDSEEMASGPLCSGYAKKPNLAEEADRRIGRSRDDDDNGEDGGSRDADDGAENQDGAGGGCRRRRPAEDEEFEEISCRNFDGADDGANRRLLEPQRQRHQIVRGDGGAADEEGAGDAEPGRRRKRTRMAEE